MPEFILDKNVDLKSTQAEYPSYFFVDLMETRKASLVLGGSGYRAEVRDKFSLLRLILELEKAGQVRTVSDELVDEKEAQIKARIDSKLGACPTECDDHHIFALSAVSGCRNILTKETRMATCRNKIRNLVGHEYCPDIRVIRNENSYNSV